MQIQTPFPDDIGDGTYLYVYPHDDSGVQETNNGWTLDTLIDYEIVMSQQAMTWQLLDEILETCGVDRDVDSKNLYISAHRDNFADTNLYLLRGLIKGA